jgi:hypothetical protein
MISDDGLGANSAVPPVAGGYPVGTAGVPPPPHKRHLVRKILLTVVGVVVVLFAAFVAWGAYLNHQKAVAAGGTSTPAGGTITPASAAPAPPDLGVALYPGATLGQAGVITTVTPTGTTVAATYTTPDSPSQVAQFYQQQLGNSVEAITLPNGAVMMSAGVTGNATTIIVTSNNGQTSISYDHGRTTAPAQ